MYMLPSMIECLKFNGTKLYQWEKFVKLTLLGRGLLEHLIDDSIGMNDPNYRIWKSEEVFIHLWLLETMTVEMCDNFLYMATVKELWSEVHKNCPKQQNDWKIYGLNAKTMRAIQGEKTIMESSCELKAIWCKIDHYCPVKNLHSEERNYILK
ncbi:unnamed protein product [Spirodela intermedia]|uniref:Uncharacterized protein n=2 Tax=Spirodela intermedia TaxID=51605 RepID=A0A7I8J2N0_SPIIN|nr:unnamed protein product [Spirodela intermedia]CAA6664464.1 unnamed protein product [Spirodela intermedia]CAA7401047.1 unnamed protein product [Spirodela intermedia]